MTHAMTSRVTIERAKGTMANRFDVGMGEAFEHFAAIPKTTTWR